MPKTLQLFPLSTGQRSGFHSLACKALCEKVTTSLVNPVLHFRFLLYSPYTCNCSPPLCLRNSYSSFKTQSSIAFFYCPSSGQPLSVLENALAQTVSIPGVGSEDWTHSQKRAWPYKGLSVSGTEVGTVLLEGPTLVHTSCTAQLTLFSTYSVPDLVF